MTLVLILLIFTLSGCGKLYAPEELLREFISAYGVGGELFCSSAKEGEQGYIDPELYKKLYENTPDPESDFAVLLSSGLDTVFEVGIFVNYDDSSALRAYETLLRRIDFLRDMGYSDSPLLLRRGRVVFYSTLPDSEKCERIFKRLDLYS